MMSLVTRHRSLPLSPSFHLLWKWAERAVGVVLQTEVFVNLQQCLLVRDRLDEIVPARIVAKQARRGDFQAAIAKTRRQFRIRLPNVAAGGAPERKDHIRQNFGDAR